MRYTSFNTMMKKRRQDEPPTRVEPNANASNASNASNANAPNTALTVEQKYKLYIKELDEFYKANKKKYITPLFEKLVSSGIFSRNNKTKDVPWQLVKMQAKVDFDNDFNNRN